VARPRERHPELVAAFIAMSVLLLGIWAATGAGYFWPVWPILGGGVPLALGARGGAVGGCGRRAA
jgi:hypothetical protein